MSAEVQPVGRRWFDFKFRWRRTRQPIFAAVLAMRIEELVEEAFGSINHNYVSVSS